MYSRIEIGEKSTRCPLNPRKRTSVEWVVDRAQESSAEDRAWQARSQSFGRAMDQRPSRVDL